MIVDISLEMTPNPNALKFVINQPVKNGSKSSYKTPEECPTNPLAQKLFCVPGVEQLHFFQNVITVSKKADIPWEDLDAKVQDVIVERLPAHDPDYEDPNPEKERRQALEGDLKKIEEILDDTVRPFLQNDGGDIQAESYQDNILIVRYQGACGSCPSSTTGTLQAVQNVLREQFDPDIEVYIAPDEMY